MQGVYDELADALCDFVEHDTPALIRIGSEAWTWLRRDVRSYGTLVLAGDKLFFQNVQIDPFCDDLDPTDFEILP